MKNITLHNLWFAYSPAAEPILQNVSGDITLGTVTRIKGRNGSGKSTLLKLLAKVYKPSRGAISNLPYGRYLNQNYFESTAASLTAREHFTMLGVTVDTEVKDNLSRYNLDLTNKLDCFMSELSGGQRQIIALLAIMYSNVPLLCLDECTSAMDYHSKKVTGAILNRRQEQNSMTIVYTTHGASLFAKEACMTVQIS